MKRINKRPFNAGVIERRIDVESIYNQMRQTIATRNELQKRHDELWKVIKKYDCDKSRLMDQIDNKIGACTHKLNGLIGNLCQYRKTHKAMTLAYRYLGGEIERINKIIHSKIKTINEVERGRCCLISSKGVTHTDTTALRNYVKTKQEQVARLQKWKQVVQKYAA